MAKYVVTGSSGRIGTAIVQAISDTHEVIGVDRIGSEFTTNIADISNYETMAPLCEHADAIIHAAALHAPHVPVQSERAFIRTNIEGTANLLRSIRNTNVKRIIFTSTTALYGFASQREDRATWIDENTVPEPRTIYHRTKLEGEKMLFEIASDDLKVRIIRMSRCFPEPAPTMAIYRLHRGVDARDVALAHRKALNDHLSSYETFVVSGQTPFQKEDLLELRSDAPSIIRRRAPNIAGLFARKGWPLPLSIDRVYDAAYANEHLGWHSKFTAYSVVEQLENGSPEVLKPTDDSSVIPE